jgi:hypothetical protein
MSTPKKVFISSTCLDLMDVRAELAEHLSRHAFLVSASDNYESSFTLTGSGSTIDTCLANVAIADAVVCILDRRYGSLVPTGHVHAGKSITHAEVLHAIAKGRPLLTFIRDHASSDVDQRRANSTHALRWIQEEALADFIDERMSIQSGGSNWVETFKTCVDLKPLLLKRLFDIFPEQGSAFARRNGQIVRMYYTDYGGSGTRVIGHFTNAGAGSALDVACGWSLNGSDNVYDQRGAVREGELFPGNSNPNGGIFTVPASQSGVAIFCTYSTPHGSRFRVEVPLLWDGSNYERDPRNWERFLIDVGGAWVNA